MKSIGRVVGFVAILGACQAGPPMPTETAAIQAADAESKAVIRDCRARYEKGELTLTGSVECSNTRVIAAFEAAKYPYMGLIRLGMAARLAGAEKVEKGEIEKADYESQLATLRARIAEEMRHRNETAVGSSAPSGPLETLDPVTRARLLEGLSAFEGLRG